jgi:hypothetical protein
METLVMFTKDKQRQKTRAYKTLLGYSLKIEGAARMENLTDEFEIVWNDVDTMSDKVKAEVFKNFATGVKALVETAGMTKEQLFGLWQMLYAGIGPTTQEDFDKGLSDMASHVQFTKASYLDALDAGGSDVT